MSAHFRFFVCKARLHQARRPGGLQCMKSLKFGIRYPAWTSMTTLTTAGMGDLPDLNHQEQLARVIAHTERGHADVSNL